MASSFCKSKDLSKAFSFEKSSSIGFLALDSKNLKNKQK